MSDRGIVWSGNFCIGDVGEMSGRGIILSGSCLTGNYPSGNCLSGICPRGSVRRGSVQSGKCPVTLKGALQRDYSDFNSCEFLRLLEQLTTTMKQPF